MNLFYLFWKLNKLKKNFHFARKKNSCEMEFSHFYKIRAKLVSLIMKHFFLLGSYLLRNLQDHLCRLF